MIVEGNVFVVGVLRVPSMSFAIFFGFVLVFKQCDMSRGHIFLTVQQIFGPISTVRVIMSRFKVNNNSQ